MNNEQQPKVLLVSYHFPPIAGGGVPRPLKMTKYLPQFGWTPVVLTVEPEYHVSLDTSLLGQVPEGVAIYRAKEWNPYQRLNRLRSNEGGAAKRDSENRPHKPSASARVKASIFQLLKKAKNAFLIPDDQRFWVSRAVRLGLKAIREQQVDIIFSTSGPYSSHLVARKLAKKTGLPWIADFRDPWTQNMHRSGIAWREWIEEKMERSVMEGATAITTVTQSFATNFLYKYPRIRRMEVIHNGYDPADFLDIAANKATDRLVFAYTGIFYQERNPRLFLQAISELIATGQLHKEEILLRFAGVFDYPGYSDNHDAVQRFGLEDLVEVLGFLPHRQSLSLLKGADVLLLINDTAPGSEAYIPGKLYEYLAVERPILAFSLAGEASAIIERFHLGKVVPPTDLILLKEAIMEFVQAWREDRLTEQFSFVNDAESLFQYQRDTQAKQLAQLMNELTHSKWMKQRDGNAASEQ